MRQFLLPCIIVLFGCESEKLSVWKVQENGNEPVLKQSPETETTEEVCILRSLPESGRLGLDTGQLHNLVQHPTDYLLTIRWSRVGRGDHELIESLMEEGLVAEFEFPESMFGQKLSLQCPVNQGVFWDFGCGHFFYCGVAVNQTVFQQAGFGRPKAGDSNIIKLKIGDVRRSLSVETFANGQVVKLVEESDDNLDAAPRDPAIQ